MRSDISEPLSYEWLAANGFREVERLDRQPKPVFRRCVALETVDEHWMRANEDLCIDVSEGFDESRNGWFCFLSRNHSPHRQSERFIHARKLRTVGDLVLLYEGLTGRQFGQPVRWNPKTELMPPVIAMNGSVTVLGELVSTGQANLTE